jgi:hypothetical protein
MVDELAPANCCDDRLLGSVRGTGRSYTVLAEVGNACALGICSVDCTVGVNLPLTSPYIE